MMVHQGSLAQMAKMPNQVPNHTRPLRAPLALHRQQDRPDPAVHQEIKDPKAMMGLQEAEGNLGQLVHPEPQAHQVPVVTQVKRALLGTLEKWRKLQDKLDLQAHRDQPDLQVRRDHREHLEKEADQDLRVLQETLVRNLWALI